MKKNNHLNNYNILLRKLDEFIRKYYKNHILKGSIYSLIFILSFFLSISLLEHFGRFNIYPRTFMFYSFFLFNTGIIVYYILIPFLHYLNFGNIINHNQAAKIIGKHFPDVKDKLLNTLQLKQLYNTSKQKELIIASIDQKIKKIKPIPFTNIINLSKNKKYLNYALIPISIIIIILITSPSILKNSTLRIIKHNQFFEKPAPFYFKILNKKLDVIQFNDYTLKIKLSGNAIPNKAYIIINKNRYLLNKKKFVEFEHTFKNVQKNISFQLFADNIYSQNHTLKVLPKPMLMSLDINLIYPKYTIKQSEHLKNVGDLVIPTGTQVEWTFSAKNTESIQMNFENNIFNTTKLNKNTFKFSKQFFYTNPYIIYTSNKAINIKDSIQYHISVIPDYYPTIKITQYKDSLNINHLFFTGEITDDYGFKKLLFKYKKPKSERNLHYSSIKIPINKSQTNQLFYFTWSLKEINIKPGEQVNYYFEIWDNDDINGNKYSISPLMTLNMPTLDELEKITKETNHKIKENLSNTIQYNKDLQEKISKIYDKILQKKALSWEDKKMLEEIIAQQKKLHERVDNLQKKNKQVNKLQSEYKQQNKEILDKQRQLEELFDEIFSDEMKALIKKFEDLLEKSNKQNALEELENAKLTNEELTKELDRMLELFKQFEFEQKLTEIIDVLKKLEQEQNDIAQKTKDKNTDHQKLSKEQQEINAKFDDIQKDLNELKEINNNLENPHSLENTEDEQQKITKTLQESLQELSKNNRNKAKDSQKQASEQIQNLTNKLEAMKNDLQMNQLILDLAAIRQILENLVTLSFDQEDIMREVQSTNTNDPKYKELIQQEYQLNENVQVVKDSLYALSKHVMQIKSFVNKEILKINTNIKKAIKSLKERQIGQATNRQQYTMTSINNLAVMLSEIMESLQQQLAQQKPGSQMCQKPGRKKGKKPSMSKMQQQLNQQLEQLTKQCNKPGGMKGLSKEFAQMAAKQAAIRNALQKLNQQENKDGKGKPGNIDKLLQEMEETETNLVNKQLTEEMLKRQKEILSRLLDAEKAQREREESPERLAEKPNQYTKEEISSFEAYEKRKQKQLELYKTVPPSLKKYYKQLVESYFNIINF